MLGVISLLVFACGCTLIARLGSALHSVKDEYGTGSWNYSSQKHISGVSMPLSQRTRKQNWSFSRQKTVSSGTIMAFGDQVLTIVRPVMLLTIFNKVSKLIANLDLGDGNQIF